MELGEVRYVIKRGTSYSCIATESLKFLDIVNYLAAGVSYDQFLKAYSASTVKSFFCYEWFSNLEQLNCTVFPRYEDFYSTLKRCNTLEPSKYEYLSEEEMTVVGRAPTKQNPLTRPESILIGEARYIELERMFYDNRWSFRDFLIYYNNR